MNNLPLTFANLPYCGSLHKLEARAAVLGIPFGTPYQPDAEVHSRDAPQRIRRESVRYPDDPLAWDFDLGQPLLGDDSGSAVDCGDVTGDVRDPSGNRLAARRTVMQILNAGAVPIVLGGDDSIPIPVLRGYEDQDPFHLLQIDAHIDWRDEVDGIRDGYSSTMRRASELDYVRKIIQVGMRGVGSARSEEYRAAVDYGAELITSYQFRKEGNSCVLKHLPEGSRCFLTIDFDALDPSEMPAVGAPTPGGLLYMELIELIQAVFSRNEIVGVSLVELVPAKDTRSLGAITAMRVVWNVLGAILKTDQP
jgi:agmatinase